jgi:hypothetical protein
MNGDFELLSMNLLIIQVLSCILSIRFISELNIGESLAPTILIGLELARSDLSEWLEKLEKLLLGYFLFNVLDQEICLFIYFDFID